MSGSWAKKSGFSFVTGAVRYSDLSYLSVVSDEMIKKKISHSFVNTWDNGDWGGDDETDVDWETVDAAVATHPIEQGLILGEHGQVMCIGSGDFHIEQIGSGKNTPVQRGPMRGIRLIGNCMYAVGMDRQIYRRDTSGSWSCIDATAKLKNEDPEATTGLEAIDGFNEKEIYAVGWDGEIWLYDGKKWAAKSSPTNVILVDICCAGDDTVYISGRAGLLIRGRADAWDIIDQETIAGDIWSMVWFQDKLYLSTMDAVYSLDGDKITRIDMGTNDPITCYQLSCRDGILWSIGAKDIMSFDGKTWTRID